MIDQQAFGFAETESVCPVCLKRVGARRILSGGNVLLRKDCREHGRFEAVIWRGLPSMSSWQRSTTSVSPFASGSRTGLGCPIQCGLCEEHRQLPCSVVLEVTSRCNLNCPVCFTEAGSQKLPDPDLKTIATWFQRVREAAGLCNLQLSGGEPTLRDDLPSIVEIGRRSGFTHLQLHTNGLRLAADIDYVLTLKKAGLTTVFLQFDGFHDRFYLFLRGMPLLETKLRAINNCGNADIGVVLVPTLVQAINTRGIGPTVMLAARLGHVVKGVHFQPISCFGRYPPAFEKAGRITLPEVMRLLENQTKGMIKVEHLSPPRRAHCFCSFSGSFTRLPGGVLKPLNGRGLFSARRSGSGAATERNLTSISGPDCSSGPGLGLHVSQNGKGNGNGNGRKNGSCVVPDGFSSRDAGDPDPLDDEMQSDIFTVSCMTFQDAWNIDLERVNGCCTAAAAPDGRLVPFCLYNLTGATGQKLYRDAAWC